MIEIILEKHGGPEGFIARPAAAKSIAAHEIRIKNTSIAINFIDIYQRAGLYPVNLPAVLGQEGVGVVTEIGSDVANFSVGDRVAYLSGGGAYASETITAAANAALIPGSLSDEMAAAGFLKGLTVQMLIKQVFTLKAGETALVYAAAGGVGSLLCQWANHIGATVIGIVGNPAKVEIAKKCGASFVVDRSQEPDIVSAVRKLTNGDGVDVVYDSIGAATFEASLDCLKPRGIMVTYGNASGPVLPVAPLELAKRGSLFMTRPTLFHYTADGGLAPMARDLFDVMETGIVCPTIHNTFPLDQAGVAQSLLESGDTTGALLLTP